MLFVAGYSLLLLAAAAVSAHVSTLLSPVSMFLSETIRRGAG